MKTNKSIILFCVLCFIHNSSCSDFTYSAFGSYTGGSPAAFGDFNSDELTDLFVISNNSYSVEILLGSSKEPYFAPNPSLKCDHDTKVTSVVPGDFDGDALMDILVTTRQKDLTSRPVNIFIHWGVYDGESKLNCSQEKALSTWDEPLAITYRTDLRTDIFAIDEHKMNASVYRFSKNVAFEEKILFSMETKHDKDLKYPHSHAFLDMNEDNSADLVLTFNSESQIWTYDAAHATFVHSSDLSFPSPTSQFSPAKTIGQMMFIDLESDDKINPIVPIVSGEESAIAVYSFDLELKQWYKLKVNFWDEDKKQEWSFDYDGNSAHYLETPTLRAGDFNNDGYVDLLATLKLRKKKDIFRTFLLENVPSEEGPFKRTFAIQWSALGPNNENAVMGAFFDFMQDGILDVIFVQYDYRNANYSLSAYKNSLDYDANFIKVMVISGIDNSSVQLPASSILGKKHFFGSSLPGPKIYYKTTNQDGKSQYGRSTQLAQSAHFALCLPYTIFGLGRTPNFVEDLVIGMFNETKQLSPIIPNSQLVIIIPNTAAKNPSKWRAQLFVTPSKIIWQTVFALTGTCIVLACIIGALHWKERREDRMERLQEPQRFHFDAM